VPTEDAKTTGGMAPGTGAYMAPEQVVGKALDARTDLYSAAIVLFEMLTGVTPFDRPGLSELLLRTAQVEQTPPPMTRLVPQAPPILDVIMARALAKDPMHRYRSALEFGEAIRSAFGLEESPGWSAEQALAHKARAISREVPARREPAGERDVQPVDAAPGPVDPAPHEDAQRLRTDVMAAFRRP
jgi:serine/threonine-protein kinase